MAKGKRRARVKTIKTQNPSPQPNYLFWTFIAGSLTVAFLASIYQLSKPTGPHQLQPTKPSDNGLDQADSTQRILGEPQLMEENEIIPVKSAKKEAALRACEKNLQDMRSKNLFAQWFNQPYRIKVDPRISEQEVNPKDIIRNVENCQQAFREILEEESFFANLLPQPNLEIILIPAELAHNTHSLGTYSVKSNMIGIAFRPLMLVDTFKQILRNEFFSHQVAARNILNGVQTKDLTHLTIPFVGKNGDIDYRNFEKFKAAVKDAKEKIKIYSKLLTRKTISPTAQEKLEEFLSASEAYFPKIYYMSEKEYNIALTHGIISMPDEKGYFSAGPNYPKNLPLSYGYKEGKLIIYTHGKDLTAKSKAIALLSDLRMQLDAIADPHSPYARMDEPHRLTELVSFFAEVPAPIQKILFPDLYFYMCEFFTTDRYIKAKNPAANLPPEKVFNHYVQEKRQVQQFFQPSPDNEKNKQEKQPSKEKHSITRVPKTNNPRRYGAR